MLSITFEAIKFVAPQKQATMEDIYVQSLVTRINNNKTLKRSTKIYNLVSVVVY